MEQAKLMDTHVQLRRIYNLLGNVLDLTQQMAEAVDRNDSVSAEMLLSMRGEPLRQIMQAREAIERQLEAALPQDREYLRGLLNGASASGALEKSLANQVAMNGRLLKQVQELDKALNLKMTREQSVYR